MNVLVVSRVSANEMHRKCVRVTHSNMKQSEETLAVVKEREINCGRAGATLAQLAACNEITL